MSRSKKTLENSLVHEVSSELDRLLGKEDGQVLDLKVWRRPCEVRRSRWPPGFSRAT